MILIPEKGQVSRYCGAGSPSASLYRLSLMLRMKIQWQGVKFWGNQSSLNINQQTSAVFGCFPRWDVMRRMSGNLDRSVYAALMQLIPQMSAKLHFSSHFLLHLQSKFKNHHLKVKKALLELEDEHQNMKWLLIDRKRFKLAASGALVTQVFLNQNRHSAVSVNASLYDVCDSEVSRKLSAQPFLLDDAN